MSFALSVLFSRSVHADSAHLFSGGLPASKVASLNWAYYTDSTYGDTIIAPAANNWNSISSKVKLSNASGTGTSVSIDAYKDTTSIPGLWGEIIPYYVDASGNVVDDLACLCHTWTYVEVYGYENQMNTSGLTNTQKVSNYTHEFGHALSLNHVARNSPSAAVMKQGQQGIGPQQTDKDHLRLKWGN